MQWLISRFPELDHLEPAERSAVLSRIRWWTYPAVVAAALFPSVIVGWLVEFAITSMPGNPIVAAAIGCLVTLLLSVFAYLWQLAGIRRSVQNAVRDGLRGERKPFCMKCGYNLRESVADRCPECGTPATGFERL